MGRRRPADGVAVPGMDLGGWCADTNTELEDPVGRGWPPLRALLPLGFLLLGRRDLLADSLEGHGEPGLQGAEAWQVRRQIVHVFESKPMVFPPVLQWSTQGKS